MGKSREPKGCYKGGLIYNEKWYPTKLALWKELGQVPLGTFKTRLYRGKTMSEALGDVKETI